MIITKNIKLILTSIFVICFMLIYWSSQYFSFQISPNYVKSPEESNKDNFVQSDTPDDDNIESVSDIVDQNPITAEQKKLEGSLRLPDNCEKVVVITTINEPTMNVKYMRDALYGWCLLVVFDKKTPTNWSYKNAFTLSLKDQTSLAEKYSIIDMIPYNSYTRKMIGYLFAINNGAKYIYETDDDNAPTDGLMGFRYNKFKGLEPFNNECNQKETKFFNPYSYFGQPSVWPRGYPLEKISDSYQPVNQKCNKLNYRIYEDKVPLIQQGLVNGDPDVDAIFRLTRKNDQALNIQFDSNAPPMVLNRNQYAPTNSQNTFFHYDSFFTLIFPLKTTMREVDILRGYISIRLLNEINGRVSFMPPNAFQIRNAHSYHKDYLEEKRLYERIYSFVSDLDMWKCDKNTIQECFLSCIENLIEKKHLDEQELEFYKAWIKDLTNIGYRWPKINRSSPENTPKTNIIYKSIEQEHSSIANKNEKSLNILNADLNQKKNLESYCEFKLNTISNSCKFDRFVLITQASNIQELDYVTLFLNIHFPYVIVCTNENSAQLFLDYISLNSSLNGITILTTSKFKSCVNSAFEIGFKQQSFMIAKDLSKFYFWSKNIQLINKEDPIKSNVEAVFDTDFYLIRRTVANAVKQIQIADYDDKNEIKSSFCSFYKNNVESSLCSNLKNQISNLIWHTNDLPSESCENIDKSKIWIPEVHDGPRADLTSTLAYLGQSPILAGYKGSAGPYPEAIKLATKVMKSIPGPIASNQIMPVSSIKTVYEFYKNDDEFRDVNFVICSFYPCWCETFIPLNKTIIFNPAHRYNLARCTQPKWRKLNSNLFMLRAKSKLILSSMSKYDEEYMGYFTGLFGYRLYSYGGYYAKGVEFNPVQNTILVGPTNTGGDIPAFIKELNEFSKKNKYTFEFKHIREIYPRYTLNQLANHRAIILFPYSVMSYSITDYYISRIPIFVPSPSLWKRVWDRSIRNGVYCGQLFSAQNRIVPEEPFNRTLHKYSPNEENDDAAYQYWTSMADYYQWPFTTSYDSLEDLFTKLSLSDFQKISDNMKDFNVIREADLLDNWCRILKTKDTTATIPKSFDEALKYFGTNAFQVE